MLSRERIRDRSIDDGMATRCCTRRTAWNRASFVSARVYRIADSWNQTSARFWRALPWGVALCVLGLCVLLSIVGGLTIASSARYLLHPWTTAIVTAIVFDMFVYSPGLALVAARVYIQSALPPPPASPPAADGTPSAEDADGPAGRRGRFFFFSSGRSWHAGSEEATAPHGERLALEVSFDPRAPHSVPMPPTGRENQISLGAEGLSSATLDLEDGHGADEAEAGDADQAPAGDERV